MQESEKLLSLGFDEFALFFGTTSDEIIKYCDGLIRNKDFRYRIITGKERDLLILDAIKKINSEGIPISGRKRYKDWEQGWQENLIEFIHSDYDLDSLIPKYIKRNVPARLNLEYIIPLSPTFVFDYICVFRAWLFQAYLSEAEIIYEFGCGPAYHLAYLASLYSEKKLVGLDWAVSSQKIIDIIRQRFGWNIKGYRFDFFAPERDFFIDKNGAVLTFGALEQVGAEHQQFLDFLLEKSPSICINVECLHEFYNDENLLSYLALLYHRKRNYLFKYLTKLKELEVEGKIEIIKCHYHKFGNIYNDTFSYVILRPKKPI